MTVNPLLLLCSCGLNLEQPTCYELERAAPDLLLLQVPDGLCKKSFFFYDKKNTFNSCNKKKITD